MRTVTTIAEVRALTGAARSEGRTVGFVPTMGFFHVGHVSLMQRARAETDVVVVSSFVNPTQFAPHEDLGAYPRDAARDATLAAGAGVDVMFVPGVDEMYPAGGGLTTVHVAELTEGMCGAARPTHFDGVTTVVAKLFAIVGPSRAYFGRKDFQQLAVVRRMTADLDLPVTVVGCPIVREADGLAMSSRNAYLSAEERAAAPSLHHALMAGAAAVSAGERRVDAIVATIGAEIEASNPLTLEYLEIRDAETLAGRSSVEGSCVLAAAARLGRARLIDNVVVTVDGATVVVDAGVRIADGTAPGATP